MAFSADGSTLFVFSHERDLAANTSSTWLRSFDNLGANVVRTDTRVAQVPAGGVLSVLGLEDLADGRVRLATHLGIFVLER